MRWQDLRRHLYGSSQAFGQDPESQRFDTTRISHVAAAPVHAWLEISCQARPA
jgi:hypothetical protein